MDTNGMIKMIENEFDLNNKNTLSGFHIRKINEDGLKLCPKMYTWHIPKTLRPLNIRPGDIVQVYAKGQVAPVLVMKVFREELEVVGKRYKRVVKLAEKAPKKLITSS
jgi:Family of unknown function (DUF5839)